MLKRTIAALNWLKLGAGAATAPSGIRAPDAVNIENMKTCCEGFGSGWYAREC